MILFYCVVHVRACVRAGVSVSVSSNSFHFQFLKYKSDFLIIHMRGNQWIHFVAQINGRTNVLHQIDWTVSDAFLGEQFTQRFFTIAEQHMIRWNEVMKIQIQILQYQHLLLSMQIVSKTNDTL